MRVDLCGSLVEREGNLNAENLKLRKTLNEGELQMVLFKSKKVR